MVATLATQKGASTNHRACYERCVATDKLCFFQAGGRQNGGRIELLNGGLRWECSSASRNSTHK